MMQRLPAIAAFANAALQGIALLILVLATAGGLELTDRWRPTLLLQSWPIPLLTALALIGLVVHPAIKHAPIAAWGGSLLLAISAWILWLVASIGTSILEGARPEGLMALLLAPLAIATGGAGAIILGAKFPKSADTPNWLVTLGFAAVFGVVAYVIWYAIYLAWLALIVWWVRLGVVLSEHQEPQVIS
ncbi:MAG: hypothetical protein R3C30_15585 [Hyphomonadaceae bacterium]